MTTCTPPTAESFARDNLEIECDLDPRYAIAKRVLEKMQGRKHWRNTEKKLAQAIQDHRANTDYDMRQDPGCFRR